MTGNTSRLKGDGHERVIELPYPISTNNLWQPYGGTVGKTKAYTRWKKEAGWTVRAQRPQALAGRYHVEIDVERKRTKKGNISKSQCDLDNCAKSIIDLLVDLNIVPDDRLMESLWMRRSDYITGARVVVYPDKEPSPTGGRG